MNYKSIYLILHESKFAQLSRFVIAGVINTGFGYGLFWILIRAGLNSQMALFISTISGVFFNFITNRSFVFKSRGYERIKAFVFLYVFIYIINSIGLFLLTSYDFAPTVAQALVISLTVPLTFILMRTLVFSRENQ